jgi:BirA family biotin operon repressor/biotin-[acetyl-CoA-carboxylase] ligase
VPQRTHTVSAGLGHRPWIVEWHKAIDSTMARSAELARSGEGFDRVVVADYQSEGRGTRGRVWIAPPGSCLMFSFIASNRVSIDELQRLPLTFAQRVAHEIQELYDIPIDVDPPNDLTIRGNKFAGILCQSHLRGSDIRWIVCGMGINTNLAAADRQVPGSTSLLIETAEPVDQRALLERLLDVLAPLRAP